ncbi:MAG: RHS repeat protein [Planctomycetes bacterium]|nr:RHS repeat protein [Planctomycetota bacterium]
MMTEQQQNSSKSLISWGLLIIVLVFAGMTVGELINVLSGGNKGSGISADTLGQIRPDKQTTQQYLGEYQKTADQLAQRNSFVPPVPSDPPGDCSVILGDEALFGNQWVKAGDMLGGSDVLEVGISEVTLLWEGKIITRSPVYISSDSKKSSGKKSSEYDAKLIEKKMKAAGAKVEGGKSEYWVTDTVYNPSGKLTEQVYNDGTRVLYDAEGKVTEKISTDGTVYNILEKTTNTQGATGGRIR